MPVQNPPTITPVPTPPIQRGDRTTFSGRVDAFIQWLVNAVGQFQALATNVYNNAVDAFNNATAAKNSADEAKSAAAFALSTTGATRWVSGTTYAQDASVISPVNGATYRRRTAGGGTTDPSADPANWAVPILNGFTNLFVLTTTQQWKPPPGVTKGRVAVIDGGDSGQGNSGGTSGVSYGDGGDGGDSGVSVVSFDPLVTYTAIIGSGGAPAQNMNNQGGLSSFSGPGITTLTTANAALKIPGGLGDQGVQTIGEGQGGGTLYAPAGSTGYGAGGKGGDNSQGSPGRPGVIIIEC